MEKVKRNKKNKKKIKTYNRKEDKTIEQTTTKNMYGM